ncbi:Pre-mRNA-processing ATP-dependent RNA helicase prp5 [Sesbania bispinosa]|nr:Pre-mRNA-processing ATP-dependent RNA helicase prp5 [Sesbania bispinosa]
MAKGDDSVRRKKNKKLRKKNNDTSSLSAKVASIIAAKKRRKAGKRRMCQGMCFSLPTPDDPFNDRHEQPELKTKGSKKKTHSRKDETVPRNGKSAHGRKDAVDGNVSQKLNEQTGKESVTANNNLGQKCKFPSKFVFWCLSAIENALRHGDAYTDGEGNSFFLNSWGLEFSKCYSTGKDLIETSGASATTEQIAWVVSAAADTL